LRNLVLIGEPGARCIIHGCVPSNLLDIHFIALDMDTLVVGAKYRSEFDEWLKVVL
jgi:ATP-dependent Clp protease ATP-binding subunit ClpB